MEIINTLQKYDTFLKKKSVLELAWVLFIILAYKIYGSICYIMKSTKRYLIICLFPLIIYFLVSIDKSRII